MKDINPAKDFLTRKYGLVDSKDNWIVSPRFDRIEPGDFDHSFKVENANMYGQINPNGGWIIGPFMKMPEQVITEGGPEVIVVHGEIVEAESSCSGLKFSLSADGVLTISGEGVIRGVNDIEKYFNPSLGEEHIDVKVSSPFKNLKFDTVIIKDGIIGLGEDCFSGCKNLKKIIFPYTLEFAYSNFAADTRMEFTTDGTFLFLGTEENPHYILLRTASHYSGENIAIPEDVYIVALGAFSYRKQCTSIENEGDIPDDEKLPF